MGVVCFVFVVVCVYVSSVVLDCSSSIRARCVAKFILQNCLFYTNVDQSLINFFLLTYTALVGFCLKSCSRLIS